MPEKILRKTGATIDADAASDAVLGSNRLYDGQQRPAL
jgi:hypothetical protein